MAALYLQGWAQAEIGEKLKIAQSTISLDLRRIHATWRESSVMDFHTRQVLELQKLDQLEREAWAAWERSQKPSQQARVKGGKSEQDADRVVKNQIGDPRFLDQVHKCIASRRALLGLDGPLRIEAAGAFGALRTSLTTVVIPGTSTSRIVAGSLAHALVSRAARIAI